MTIRLKKLIGLLFLLAPLSVFAGASSGDSGFFRFFTPGEGDLSVKYLGELFGTVGGVLQGAGGQALGQLFGVLNSGILALAGIFLIYTIFMTVVNTAQEGEVMGRKFSSTWIALRTACGILFLIPSKATGYSLVQVVVMWVVIQGIGLANQAWDRTINYLRDEGGVLYVKGPTTTESAIRMVPTAINILKAEVCMFKVRDLLAANEKKMKTVNAENTGATPITIITNSPQVGYGIDSRTRQINFGSKSVKASGGYNNECGSISWSQITGSLSQAKADYVERGVTQMVLDMGPVARRIAEGKSADAVKDQAANAIVVSVQSYANIINPALAGEKNANKDKLYQKLEDAKEQGWILAGSYYRHIGALNTEIEKSLDNFFPSVTTPPAASDKLKPNPDGSPNVLDVIGVSGRSVVDKAVNVVNFQNDAEAVFKKIAELNKKRKDDENGPLQDQGIINTIWASGGSMATAAVFGGPHLSAILLITTGVMHSLAQNWLDSMSGSLDPILNLQKFGNHMVTIATGLWIAITGAIFLGTIAYGLIPSVPGPSPAVQSSLKWFLGVLGTVLASLFGMGLMLSVYIPLIPYLIFTFAGIGWFVAVLEVMIAAPLVALGVTHPEGHDLLGKAEQAVMILLSVFLRPVLLIIGLITAMILVRVVVRLINTGFAIIVAGVGEGVGSMISGVTSMFTIIALMAVYTMLMIYTVNTVFNIIPVLAEKVMRVLGLHPESAGYHQELKAIEGATQQAGSTAGHASTQPTELPGNAGGMLDKDKTLGGLASRMRGGSGGKGVSGWSNWFKNN